MAVTDAIITALRSHAGIQALVGNGDSPETYRIYNLVRPQNETSDAIVIERVNVARVSTLTDAGGSGVENVRLRVSSYSSTLTRALALAAQVKDCFKNVTTFKSTHLMEFDQFEDDSGQYRVIIDFSIWYK